jgi:hypothetical protein
MQPSPRSSNELVRRTAAGRGLLKGQALVWLALSAALVAVACHSGPTEPAGSGGTGAAGAVAAPGDLQLIQAGYQRQMRQGRVVYCRVETVTGSRFSSTVCASKEQVQANWEAAQRQLQGQRVNADCTLVKASCPGG